MHRVGLVLQSIRDLKSDFVGFTFNVEGFSSKIIQFLLVALLFYIMYCVGRFFERKLFKGSYDQNLSFFVRFSLGYIIVGTAIFLLGFFSVVTPVAIILLLLAFGLFTHFEAKNNSIILKVQSIGKLDGYKILCISLAVIYFLRLIPPAAAGDSLD